uniref:Uncharacterized protein n=1 Tax=Arundo donax TaxID=35708 RepID=A0A0A9BA28_ARUDO
MLQVYAIGFSITSPSFVILLPASACFVCDVRFFFGC